MDLANPWTRVSHAPPGDTLGAVIGRTRHLLLDFDGPICSIFAGLPAPVVADRLREVIPGDVQIPDSIADTPDPMEVFSWSATISGALAARIEAELAEQEVTAAITAEPTPYLDEVVIASRESGRSLAVVSNNSGRAVRTYLARHGLTDSIPVVMARTSHDPSLLKPNPYLIKRAAEVLIAQPGSCTLVGDSTTDIEGARLAGVRSIGYANKPGKSDRLTAAGADAVITSLAELVLRLRPVPLSGTDAPIVVNYCCQLARKR